MRVFLNSRWFLPLVLAAIAGLVSIRPAFAQVDEAARASAFREAGATNAGVVISPQALAPFERIDLSVAGPMLDEREGVNPFTDIRLDWTIRRGDRVWVVPAYFAGCGAPADTGCTGGNQWRAHFIPPEAGTYSWQIAFHQGADVSISQGDAEPLPGHGASGTFTVKGQSADPLRARGMLRYTGAPYYQYAGNGSIFFKFGPDAPENMLAFEDFDATPNTKGLRKNWQAHADDLKPAGDAYRWGPEKRGAGILGMIDYLAAAGANSLSMLLWNAGGDDRNVMPHILAVSPETYSALEPRAQWTEGLIQDRFDISKLDQWHRVLSYADMRGLHLHFKLQEIENDDFMDDGALGRTRRLYLREMVARFGHFLALTWNLGEENAQSPGDVRQMADYLRHLDVYDHPIVIHSYPDEKERYRALLGPSSALNGLSLQGNRDDMSDLRDEVIYWSTAARAAGKPVVVSYDEPGSAEGGAGVDPDYPDAALPAERALLLEPDVFLKDGLWNALTAGASGVEAYYGYKTGCSDLDCQDHRTRARLWREGAIARRFFETHVGARALRMVPADHVTVDDTSYVFAEPDQYYVIVPGRDDIRLTVGSIDGQFDVRWYDRARGGPLQTGSIARIEIGPRHTPIGDPPASGSGRWVAVVSRASDGLLVEQADFASRRTARRDDAKDRANTGPMTVLTYTVDFPAAGRWYLWVRADGSGGADSTIHAGLDGNWPESAQRIQFCAGADRGHWDSRQRTPDNRCGPRGGIWLDVAAAGTHDVMFAVPQDDPAIGAFYLTQSPHAPASLPVIGSLQ